jgi:hypothetical protein
VARRTRAELKTEYLVGRATPDSARERDPAPEPPEFPCIAGIGLEMARVQTVGADRNPDGDEAVNKANQLSRKDWCAMSTRTKKNTYERRKAATTPAKKLASWRDRPAVRPTELASLSGLSLRTVRRRIASGSIRSHLSGRCRMVPISEVFRLLGEEPTARESSCRPIDPKIRAAIAKVTAKVAKGAR